MVRKGNHISGGVVPLLQERFRQLQRMKELREEKELLRMLSESERSYISPPTNKNYHEPVSEGSQLIMFLPPKPQPDSSPIFNRAVEGPLNLSQSLFANAPLVCASPIKIDQDSAHFDIDTSLHL